VCACVCVCVCARVCMCACGCRLFLFEADNGGEWGWVGHSYFATVKASGGGWGVGFWR